MKLKRVKCIFKTLQKFSSDEELRNAKAIKIHLNSGERFLPPSGRYRGVLRAEVKRRNGYARVYLRGIVDYIVYESECRCCDEVYGTFRPENRD